MTRSREHHFHGCPECSPERGPDDVYNAGKSHRGACHTHKTSWWLGSNLLSGWRDETEADQRERWCEMDGYQDVAIG
jgi:hypothetical protein